MTPVIVKHCCADVVDTSAVIGRRQVPKNTQPLAFLLTVASHGTVLSEPASEQQAGHIIPVFSAYAWACLFTYTHTHSCVVAVYLHTKVCYSSFDAER